MTNKLSAPVRLTLYGRDGCHLCEDMREALEEYREALGFELESINIDADPALQAAHGLKIPVLMHGNTEICHYFLDPAALQTYFSQAIE